MVYNQTDSLILLCLFDTILNMQTEPTPPQLTVFTTPPSKATCYLVNRNLSSLLENAFSETRFSNSLTLKSKALQLLKNIAYISGSSIQPHIDKVFYKLAQIYLQENDSVDTQLRITILETVQIVGFNVSLEVTFPMIMKLLKTDVAEGNSKLTPNFLLFLDRLLLHQTQSQIEDFRGSLFQVVKMCAGIFSENDEGLASLLGVAERLIQKFKEIKDGQETSTLFDLLLNIQATRTSSEGDKKRSREASNRLAYKCGYTSTSQLNANQVGPIIQKITSTRSYLSWNKTSKERFQFDTLVRNCQEVIPKFMDGIVEILQAGVSPKNDLEVRMDILVLVQYILGLHQIHDQLKQHSVRIMKTVLIPSIMWKIGAPQTKIRKAGVINMTTLISNDLIQPVGILSCYKQLMPPLKNCLTDDREPDLRKVCLSLVEQLLLHTQSQISQDDLRDLYTSLLERMDDSKGQLRVQTTVCISLFFGCNKLKLIPTIFQYLLSGVLVHFDSESDSLRDAVLVSLKHACKVNPKKVMEMAQVQLRKMRHTAICEELIRYCEECLSDV